MKRDLALRRRMVGSVERRCLSYTDVLQKGNPRTSGTGSNYEYSISALTSCQIDDISEWNPDFVIFSDHNCFESVFYCKDEVGFLWSLLPAVLEKRLFEIPCAFYSWFGSPPLFIQTIGLLWLGNIIYPEIYDFDINAKAQEFYRLFLDREFSMGEVEELTADSPLVPIVPKPDVMILDGEE